MILEWTEEFGWWREAFDAASFSTASRSAARRR